MEKLKMTFAAAMKHFFGAHPTIPFINEMKALTPEDKAFFRAELERVGYELVAAG